MWTLQIRGVQPRDQGEYQCQAATSTGVRTMEYWLQVHKPRSAILGSRENHVNLGDSNTISCVSEPEAVFWYHKDSMINYLPGMVVITSMIGPDPDSLWVAPPDTTVSRKTIAQAGTGQ